MSNQAITHTDIHAYAFYWPPDAAAGARMLALGFTAYAATVVSLSAASVYAAIAPEFFAFTIVAAIVGLAASYFRSPAIRAFAERLGPYGLAWFHVWRIAAAFVFFAYQAHGMLHPAFVALAGWGDLIAGTLCIMLFLLPRGRALVTGFHLAGLADFMVAVGTGLMLTWFVPGAMDDLVDLPISLIPLVGVPISGASHIVALHLLSRR